MQGQPVTPFFQPIRQAVIILLISLAMLGGALALYSARWIVLAALIGVGFGALFSPALFYLKRKLRLPTTAGAFLFFCAILALMFGTAYALYVMLADQVAPLIGKLPALLLSAKEEILRRLARFPWLRDQVASLHATAPLKGIGPQLMVGLQTGATVLGGFVFVLFVALYVAVSPGGYIKGFLSAFPAHMRPKVTAVLRESGRTLRGWFGAQLIAMAMVGAATGLGLWAVGVDYWLVFGILTGLLDFIPYIGPLIACTGVSLVTLGAQPDKVWLVVGVFVLMQQIEGDIVIPVVMKGRCSLPPIQLMTLMLVMGDWFGILGVFVAPPLLAVLRTVYLMTYVPKMDEKVRRPADLVKKTA